MFLYITYTPPSYKKETKKHVHNGDGANITKTECNHDNIFNVRCSVAESKATKDTACLQMFHSGNSKGIEMA